MPVGQRRVNLDKSGTVIGTGGASHEFASSIRVEDSEGNTLGTYKPYDRRKDPSLKY